MCIFAKCQDFTTQHVFLLQRIPPGMICIQLMDESTAVVTAINGTYASQTSLHMIMEYLEE